MYGSNNSAWKFVEPPTVDGNQKSWQTHQLIWKFIPLFTGFLFNIQPVVGLGISEPSTWSNYSDLTRPHPKWWFSKGNPLISGKPRLVKYYNLARSTVRRLQSQPWGLLIFYWDRWCFWVTWIPYFAVQLDEYLTIPKTLFGVIHRIHVWYPPGTTNISPKWQNGWVEKAFSIWEIGPNWSILVETFTNMGNKEPNSTCFIARFLNHQLGVAMGVMIHPPNKKRAFDTKMVNLIPRLQQSKCYRVCVFPYLFAGSSLKDMILVEFYNVGPYEV